jgi:hypothetical protein
MMSLLLLFLLLLVVVVDVGGDEIETSCDTTVTWSAIGSALLLPPLYYVRDADHVSLLGPGDGNALVVGSIAQAQHACYFDAVCAAIVVVHTDNNTTHAWFLSNRHSGGKQWTTLPDPMAVTFTLDRSPCSSDYNPDEFNTYYILYHSHIEQYKEIWEEEGGEEGEYWSSVYVMYWTYSYWRYEGAVLGHGMGQGCTKDKWTEHVLRCIASFIVCIYLTTIYKQQQQQRQQQPIHQGETNPLPLLHRHQPIGGHRPLLMVEDQKRKDRSLVEEPTDRTEKGNEDERGDPVRKEDSGMDACVALSPLETVVV